MTIIKRNIYAGSYNNVPNMFVICKADFSVNADNNDLSGDNNDSKVFDYSTTNVQNSLYTVYFLLLYYHVQQHQPRLLARVMLNTLVTTIRIWCN